VIDAGTTIMELCSGEERWGLTVITHHRHIGIYSHRAGWGLVAVKLLSGNIRSQVNSDSSNLTGCLLEVSQGDQTPPGGWQRIRNLIKYQNIRSSEDIMGWEFSVNWLRKVAFNHVPVSHTCTPSYFQRLR
jgi:hypothetical protein